jgi:hypothetical protein
MLAAAVAVSAEAKLEQPMPRARDGQMPIGAGYAVGLSIGRRETFADELTRSVTIGGSGMISVAAEDHEADATAARVARLDFAWHVGGGGSGFDGAFLLDMGHGVRWPAAGHGVVLRGGGRGQLQGNDAYYFSLLALPQADLGYQFNARGVVFELSGRAALLWDGRFRSAPSSSTRDLDFGVGWGALAELGLSPMVLSGQLLRSGEVTSLTAHACTRLWKFVGSCVRAEHLSDGSTLLSSDRNVLIGGLSFGFAPQ